MNNTMKHKMLRITYKSGNWDEVTNIERYYTTNEELVIVHYAPNLPNDLKEYINLDEIRKIQVIYT